MRRSSIPHLFRRGDWFYFRAAIPRSWRRTLGKPEIKIALRTRDPHLARIVGAHLSNAMARFVRQLPSMSDLSLEQVRAFARQYFQERLNEGYALAEDIPVDPQLDPDLEVADTKEAIAAYKDSLRKRQYPSYVKLQARELLDQLKPPGSTISLDVLSATYDAITRAEIEKCRYVVAMLSGRPHESAPVDPMFSHMVPAAFPPIDGNILGDDQSDADSALTFQAAADDFIAKKGKAVWVGKTKDDYRRVLTWAGDVIGGNRRLADIATNDVKTFRDALAVLPSNLAKQSPFDGKSFSDIVRMKHDAETISIKTQDKYFSMFRSFLRWCLEEELIDKVPGMGVKVIGAGQKAASDRVLSKDQLVAIFSSPFFIVANRRLAEVPRAKRQSETRTTGYPSLHTSPACGLERSCSCS